MDWIPIETAPRDGTKVDLWCKRSWNPPQTHERSTDMYWCMVHNCWRQAGHEHYVDDMWKHRDGYAARYLIPELWRPLDLPPPPNNAKVAEGEK